ncbi:MAG: acyl-CoA synthetase [Nitrospirae bacterium GWC2_57_13]|nr:MAG: acyl-CoA synthetase [Nitrospirae bacterium GWC1_57_7]OGW27415.1 MAG: acyl-CoA synthetase [Nitrospirae bacterium GWC2_57_13]HAR46122.1 acyl-CoA synthetase [Nitrospiraceae bacterium]
MTDKSEYETLQRTFRIEAPAQYNFGFDVVDRHGEDPSRRALLWVDAQGRETKDLSFRDISQMSNRYANVLRSQGVKKGDRVFVMLPRIPEWYGILTACHKLGAVAMPAPVILMPSDIQYRLSKGSAVVAITNEANRTKVEEALSAIGSQALQRRFLAGGGADGWHDLEALATKSSSELSRADVEPTAAGDPFIIYFTSGTTRYPKMVLHSCDYPLGHLRTAALWHGLNDTDLIWVVSDTGWAKSAWGLYGQWVIGAGLFVHNAEGRFNAKLTLELMTTKGATVFCGPPTVYRMLILEDLGNYDYSGLRRFTSAGEPLNPEVIKVWKDATGKTIHEGYGQTESTLLIGTYPFMDVKPGSMGRPAPDLTIEILDEDLKPLPVGETGFICVRTEPRKPVGLFDGYLEDAGENARVFRDGWYNTGDKAFKDTDGYFTFVGRGDDIIKASGYRIGPFEVESVVQEHPAVAENAVVASPDALRGEIIKAFIVLAPGHSASDTLAKEIQDFVKARTAPYKYPREVEFMTELPKTVSGKIKRAVLRNREIERKKGKAGLGGG